MRFAPLRTARFVTRWLSAGGGVREREVGASGDAVDEATLYRPAGSARNLPSWIVLHGITRPGRHHPELVRFARSLAGSGAVVLVPEIPEWRELSLDPERTGPVIADSLERLSSCSGTVDRPVGVVGFSFGAPQAVLAAADPALAGRIGAVVGFGGYCDLEQTVRFLFTGEHRFRDRRYEIEPDPYGRWIIGANVLHRTDEHDDAADVARALRRLAALAGDRRIDAWTAGTDPLKDDVRRDVAPERQELFDLFAPPAGREPDRDAVDALIPRLVRSARRWSPLLDPSSRFEAPPCPVHLIHGRDDRLVPFTETLRMADALPEEADVHVTITRLFSHSKGSGTSAGAGLVREGWRFLRAMSGVLGSV